MFISLVNMGILTYLWDIGLGFLVLSSSGHSRKCSFASLTLTLLIFQSQNLKFLERIYKQTNFNQRKYSFKLCRNA